MADPGGAGLGEWGNPFLQEGQRVRMWIGRRGWALERSGGGRDFLLELPIRFH